MTAGWVVSSSGNLYDFNEIRNSRVVTLLVISYLTQERYLLLLQLSDRTRYSSYILIQMSQGLGLVIRKEFLRLE